MNSLYLIQTSWFDDDDDGQTECFISERIDIAIDPFTGRNPSYCFVDLETKEQADRAMAELDGRDLLGRPVKIKPGVVKTLSERSQQRVDGSPRGDRKSPATFDRWQRNTAPSPSSPSSPSKGDNDQSRRVYVGGLPRLSDPETINSNIANFFKGLNVYVFLVPFSNLFLFLGEVE